MQYPDTSKSFYNIDAERSVIGCFLVSESALKCVPELSADDFRDSTAKAAFQAIQRLVAKRERVDLVTVDDELTRMGSTGHTESLVKLSQYGHGAAMASAYAKIVKDMATRRRVREIAQQTLDAISDPQNETGYVVGQCRQALRDIQTTKHTWMDMSGLMLETYTHLDRVANGEITPIRCGIPSLDNLIGGFFPGEMTVVGARPGVGKSAFALEVGVCAAKADRNVCVVSLEMYAQQFGQRLFSKGSGVNGMKIRTGDLDNEAWAALAETMAMYSELPMSFLFRARYIEDIIVEAQRKADEGKLDMLIVDYLQLVRTKQRFESERLRVGHVSAELKNLSTDLNVPVIALSQLSRPEKGKNYEPRMSDLRESGAIEQDADGVILMHRPEKSSDPGINPLDVPYFDSLIEGGKHYISFIVDKQRQGEIGRRATVFDPAVMTFRGIVR